MATSYRVGRPRVVATFLLSSVLMVSCASEAPASAPTSAADGSQAPQESEPNSLGFDTVEPGFLTVAFTDGLLPNIALTEENALEGTEGSLLTKVAETYGLEIRPLPTTFAGELLAVQQGIADVASSIFYTEERSHEFYYTMPFLYSLQTFVTRADTPYENAESLRGKTIGVAEGNALVPHLQAFYGEENVKLYQSLAVGYADLESGQIDAYAAGSSSRQAVRENPDWNLHVIDPADNVLPDSVGRALLSQIVHCDNPGLAEAIDEVLLDVAESEEWRSILEEWLYEPDEDIPPLEPPVQRCSS